MPVRIYDIAKKLGIESKDVLLIAKDLRIAAAKVPSSSLDKISAEWLEEEIIKSRPDIAARLNSPHVAEPPKPAPVEEKILIISAPAGPAADAQDFPAHGCAGHYPQTADCRPRPGGSLEAATLHHHRRTDEAEGHGHGEPGH